MPWKESKALDERKRFLKEWEKGEDDIAELCRRYGITRQTGYKWAKRYEQCGVRTTKAGFTVAMDNVVVGNLARLSSASQKEHGAVRLWEARDERRETRAGGSAKLANPRRCQRCCRSKANTVHLRNIIMVFCFRAHASPGRSAYERHRRGVNHTGDCSLRQRPEVAAAGVSWSGDLSIFWRSCKGV